MIQDKEDRILTTEFSRTTVYAVNTIGNQCYCSLLIQSVQQTKKEERDEWSKKGAVPALQ